MKNVTLGVVYTELKKIKSELDFIKEHMVDSDTLLTKEEGGRLERSIEELKEKKTISFDEIKEE